MNTIRRTVLLVGLCCTMTGCTATHQVVLPGEAPIARQEAPTVRTVRVGMRARVTLRTGKKVEGEVLEAGEDSITLGKVGNYGLEKTVIPVVDIVSIEISEPTELSSFIATMVLVAVTIMALLTVAVAATIDVPST